MGSIVSSHTHVQSTPSSQWVVNHGLNCRPVVGVSVMHEGVLTVIQPASIEFNSLSQVTITFSSARTGEARLT